MHFLVGAGLVILFMMLCIWLLFGAFIGWIASVIMGTNRTQGFWMDLLVGIVGAIVGGLVFAVLGFHHGGVIWSFLTSILGAIIFLWILGLARKGRAAPTA